MPCFPLRLLCLLQPSATAQSGQPWHVSWSKEGLPCVKKPDYAHTVTENCITKLQRGYFNCFGVTLNLKPTQEELEHIDDSTTDPEPAVSDLDILSDGEYVEVMRVFNECQTGVQEAFLALLQQLTGKGFLKLWCITASNHWQSIPENRALIDKELTVHMTLLTLKKNRAGICTKVISDLFNALSPKAQEEWKGVSKEQHELAILEWTRKTEGPLSEAPKA
ncbi:hypothetical protein DXG01_009632 [Tephrocybe rancida]|nr:hypothetical protein DXG01_009632 [Tephrocybe rancida]